jgi:hypothetical protein
MKKLLLVLAIAGTVAACNDEKKSETETTTSDTTVVPAPAPVDTTTVTVDTTAKPTADTTKK